MTPRPEDFAKLAIPVLTIAGHYDADQLGALTYYARHLANGNPDATRNHLLVIGPWDHYGTRRPKPKLGGLDFGKEVTLNFEELHKAWYDHVLKGGPMPEFLKDRVACFIMGRNGRLRLIVTTGPYVSWQRNTNTGGDLATEPLSHGRVAHLTLMTGPGTGSELDLPQPDAGLLKTPSPAGAINR